MSSGDSASDTYFEHLTPPYDFSSPLDGEDFAALVVVNASLSDDDRASLAENLINEGCRHAVVWGQDCDDWESALDEAVNAATEEFSVSDRIVMITSQEDESLEDVIDFFFDDTSFESFDPEHFVALVVGGSSGDAENVQELLHKRESGESSSD